MMPPPESPPAGSGQGSAAEVLRVFLQLGCTSFGGPIAHLGYFRAELVARRKWLDDAAYGDLVALCQFLPGPASSQVAVALGLQRAGWRGACAAWIGFTLPSAVLLILFALGVAEWGALAGSGALQGLKLAAVAVVIQAVWGMARSFCTDFARTGIAVAAALLVLLLPSSASQVAAIALGALAGAAVVKSGAPASGASHLALLSRRTGVACLLLLAALLFALPAAGAWLDAPGVQAFGVFYQAGALVFGGGHVVLPLLQAGVVPNGWISNDAFLAGYGAAQAVPGPLFSFAAYLGAVMGVGPGGWPGGLLMLVAIFLPAVLLVVGALPFWDALRSRPGMRRAMAGCNAAVVGVLAAALYDPLWANAVHRPVDVAIVVAGAALLLLGRVSPVLLVLAAAVIASLVY